MSQQISPLVAAAVGWMYGHRNILSLGYSGQDPAFKAAKALFLETMRKSGSQETDESLIQAFEKALNLV